MTTLKGKTVLLTGASRGIGTFIAREMAQQGAIIVGVARDFEKLNALCVELQDTGAQCFSMAWDLHNIDTLAVLIDQIEQTIGSVDILINNAGIERYRAFQDYSLEDLKTIISVNLMAAMEMSRLLLPGMLSRGCGHIVNMASTAAKKGHPFDSVYSASKAGLLMWSDALRQELVDSDVEVSVICPGYVEQSGMMADTGIPAPLLAGATTPMAVATAVTQAIKKNKAEVIVNRDLFSTSLSKLLFAAWQVFPRFGDVIYRAVGIPKTNQQRMTSTALIAEDAHPQTQPALVCKS